MATCSPLGQENYKKYGTCFSPKEVTTLAKTWNVFHPKYAIPVSAFSSVKKLVSELQMRFDPICGKDRQDCWVETDIVRKGNLYQLMSPKLRPMMKQSWLKNKHEWLDNHDIKRCIQQYEEKYTSFEFLGAIPRDAMCESVCSIYKTCSVNVTDMLRRKKTELGVVFNLDRHTESGSHWVALYANFRPRSPKFGIYYYDSVGDKPPKEITEFMQSIKQQVGQVYKREFTEHFNGHINIVRHQYKNSECGMFSMVFLILCLEKKNMDFYQVRDLIPKRSDDDMNKLRFALYRTPTTPLTGGKSKRKPSCPRKKCTFSSGGSSRTQSRCGDRDFENRKYSRSNR